MGVGERFKCKYDNLSILPTFARRHTYFVFRLTVTFVTKDGSHTVKGKEGDSLVQVHDKNNLDFYHFGKPNYTAPY